LSSRDLYELLPAVYRRREAERESPLRALLELLAADLGKLERDVAELYDDWFIATSANWTLVYVGGLLGGTPRATQFAVTPVVDQHGRLSDFKLHAQTFRLHRVCSDTEPSKPPPISLLRRVAAEYTPEGPSASSLTERARIILKVRFEALNARSEPGYQGLENQMYRVQIHEDAARGDSQGFAWSRGNGALVAVLDNRTGCLR